MVVTVRSVFEWCVWVRVNRRLVGCVWVRVDQGKADEARFRVGQADDS